MAEPSFFFCESRWLRQPHKAVPLDLCKTEDSHGLCFGHAVSLCAISDVQFQFFDLHGFLFSGPRAACRGDLLQALPQAVHELRQPVAVDPTLAWREDHAPGKVELDPVERPAFSDFLEISQDIVVDLGQREIPAAIVFVR